MPEAPALAQPDHANLWRLPVCPPDRPQSTESATQACRKCLCSVHLASLDKALFPLIPSKAGCVSRASTEGDQGLQKILGFSLLSLLFLFSLPSFSSLYSLPSSTPPPTLQSLLFPLCRIYSCSPKVSPEQSPDKGACHLLPPSRRSSLPHALSTLYAYLVGLCPGSSPSSPVL